jgi:hypothetical protein
VNSYGSLTCVKTLKASVMVVLWTTFYHSLLSFRRRRCPDVLWHPSGESISLDTLFLQEEKSLQYGSDVAQSQSHTSEKPMRKPPSCPMMYTRHPRTRSPISSACTKLKSNGPRLSSMNSTCIGTCFPKILEA